MSKKIYAERQIWTNGIAVYVAEGNSDGFLAVLRPGVFEALPKGAHKGEPSLHLEYEEAQKLMDELWSCGLRPSEGTGSAGSLAATERHLKDMQTIAKGLLRKDGVEL